MGKHDTHILRQGDLFFMGTLGVVLTEMTVFIAGQLRLVDDLLSEFAELFEQVGYFTGGDGFVLSEDGRDGSVETGVQSFLPPHKLILDHSRVYQQI